MKSQRDLSELRQDKGYGERGGTLEFGERSLGHRNTCFVGSSSLSLEASQGQEV